MYCVYDVHVRAIPTYRVYQNVLVYKKKKTLFSDDPVVCARLSEALETVLNKTQELNKSKKVQHSNTKNAVLFESINLILHFQG